VYPLPKPLLDAQNEGGVGGGGETQTTVNKNNFHCADASYREYRLQKYIK